MKIRSFSPLLLLSIVAMLLLSACAGASAPAEAPAAEPAATEAAVEEIAEEAEATEAEATEEGMAGEEAQDAPVAQAVSSGEELTGTRTFTVVPEASQAAYVVDEEFLAQALDKLGIAAGATVVVGSTNDVAGSLTINLDDKSIGENQFTVNMTTLSTDQNRRDNWIRENGPRFNSFPEASFVATSVENAPESYVEGQEATFQLVGDLTVRDVTVPATFDVTATINGDTLTGIAESNLRMSDFGIDPPNFAQTLTVADPFKVRMELTAQAQ
jgi:polyisoprenoid-binding protein YceI